MPTTPLFPAIMLIACLTACSSSDKQNPLLLEAANYHQQSTDIQATVEPQIDHIDSLKTVLMATKMPATAAHIATLDSLKTAFED